MSRAPELVRPFFQAARGQLEAYRDRLRRLHPGEVFPGVTWVPMPGHTPGHTGFVVASGDASLLIWGVLSTFRTCRSRGLKPGSSFDTDPVAAAATRRRVLDMVATDRLLVGGMHIHFPGFARVVRDGTRFQMVPDVWTDDL